MENLYSKIREKQGAETTCPRTYQAYLRENSYRRNQKHLNIKRKISKASHK
jgi:hypothetical protein